MIVIIILVTIIVIVKSKSNSHSNIASNHNGTSYCDCLATFAKQSGGED